MSSSHTTQPRRFFQLSVVALSLAWAGAVMAADAGEPSLVYTVKTSDKLSLLTKDMLITPKAWSEVAKFNKLPDPNKIYPNQKLNIPLRLLKPQAAGVKVIAVQGQVSSSGNALATGATLAEGAKVQTGTNSSAVLELADGSRVKLLPSTLAEVAQNRNYAMRDASQSGSTTWYSGLMRLVQGGLDVLASKDIHRATPLQIETPTSLVGVRGTVFRVGYDNPATRNSRTEVIEGKVRADNPAQASGADLNGGYGAVINPTVKEVKVVQLLPAPNLTSSPAMLQQSGHSAEWGFDAVPGAVSYRIQVASDGQFNQLLQDIRTSGNHVNLAALSPGIWHVRVRAVDAQGLEGFDSSKSVTLSLQTGQLLQPRFSVRNGRSIFQFEADTVTLSKYKAVIATDAQFTQIIRETQLNGHDWQVDGLKGGAYYLKLQPASANAATEMYRFELPENWGETVFDSVGGLTPLR